MTDQGINKLVGALRDTANGCEIWNGEAWVHHSNKSSQETNTAVFEQLNPLSDKLTIEQIEKIEAMYRTHKPYAIGEKLPEPIKLPTNLEVIYQLADTMRENERLLEVLMMVYNSGVYSSTAIRQAVADAIKPYKHTETSGRPQMDVTRDGLLNIEHLYDPTKTQNTDDA